MSEAQPENVPEQTPDAEKTPDSEQTPDLMQRLSVEHRSLCLRFKYLLLTGFDLKTFEGGMSSLRTVDEFLARERKGKVLDMDSSQGLTKSTVFAEYAIFVEAFRTNHDFIEKFHEDIKHFDVLKIMQRIDNSNEYYCWQEMLTCVAMLLRSKQCDKDYAAKIYKQLPKLIKNSRMLFYFLESLKLVVLKKRAGWGRGLKNAVRRWYSKLSPAELLLELWHHPHGHGWAHKDVMKLAHLKQSDLELGSQVIVQWFFTDLAKTKVVFGAEKAAYKYIVWLDCLYNKDHEEKLYKKRIETLVDIAGKPYEVSKIQDPIFMDPKELPRMLQLCSGDSVTRVFQDPSFIALITPQKSMAPKGLDKDEEIKLQSTKDMPDITEEMFDVAAAMEERMEQDDSRLSVHPTEAIIALNNFVRRGKNYLENLRDRNKWRSDEGMSSHEPSATSGTTLPMHLESLCDAMGWLILYRIRSARVAEKLPDLVVIFESVYKPGKFVNSNYGINVHKQMRVSQAMVMLSMVLCERDCEVECGGYGDRVVQTSTLVSGPDTKTETNFICCKQLDYGTSIQNMEEHVLLTDNQKTVPSSFEFLLNYCKENNKKQLVYCDVTLCSDTLVNAYKYLKSEPEDGVIDRIVMISFEKTFLPAQSDYHPRLLVVNGFDMRTMNLVIAFLTQWRPDEQFTYMLDNSDNTVIDSAAATAGDTDSTDVDTPDTDTTDAAAADIDDTDADTVAEELSKED